MTQRILALAVFAILGAAQQRDWLAVCGRCPSPTVFQKTGIGKANAVAQAKFTLKDFEGQCSGQGLKGAALTKCMTDELKADPKVYRATANCQAGTLEPIQGGKYMQAGVWGANSIGEGRSRWRNVETGAIADASNAGNGLALSQQWEVLCPKAPAVSQAAPAAPAPPAAVAPVAVPPVCNGAQDCIEVNPFAATITDLRESTDGSSRLVTASIRFQNKLRRPIILGYVAGSGVVIDDRGNRFAMQNNTGLRGIGLIQAGRLDPKFIIAAGQTADARVEYSWFPRGGEVFGTQYKLEFAVREIVPVSASQFRVGLEYPLEWGNLGQAPPPAASSAASASAQVEAGPIAPPVDHCEGQTRCYSADTFSVRVQQIAGSRQGSYQAITLRLRFQNHSNQPLVLAYKDGTSSAIDNHGHRYTPLGANAVRGIGTSRKGSVNADFVLSPGQTREATFEVSRYVGNTLIGTGFTYDVSVEQLELLPANQVRAMREISMNFPDLTAATPAAGSAAPAGNNQSLGESVQGLKDLFKKKKK